MPDYLAFERVTALMVRGNTNEDKGIFDVDAPGLLGEPPWGISCKMASAQPLRNSCWFMELSNSAKYLHDALAAAGIRNWVHDVAAAGPVLVDTVESWHERVSGNYDLANSKYLLCTHDSRWVNFEIACFDLNVLTAVDPRQIDWRAEGRNGAISSLAGYIDTSNGPHRLWQWYANSGGQLKFYPPVGWEEWRSGIFQLEEPPLHDLVDKVETYWPGAWPR